MGRIKWRESTVGGDFRRWVLGRNRRARARTGRDLRSVRRFQRWHTRLPGRNIHSQRRWVIARTAIKNRLHDLYLLSGRLKRRRMDFTELIDLAAERLGGAVLIANDEFFAPKEHLLKPDAPVFREGEYTDRGKWMDGWETRRRRTPGFDWCIIRLGLPGIVRGIVVDTSYFRGNYPEHCSLEAMTFESNPTNEEITAENVPWIPLLPQMSLAGDSQN